MQGKGGGGEGRVSEQLAGEVEFNRLACSEQASLMSNFGEIPRNFPPKKGGM